MPYTLSEVDPETDFQELIACEWDSYENPHQNFFRLFCPILGDGSNARKESIEECTQRQLEWLKSDPTSYWQKVTDSGGKIVGGALWKICPTNPFEHEDHEEAYWYPEGGARDFVNKALEIFEAPRARMGQRPQVCKYSLVPLLLVSPVLRTVYPYGSLVHEATAQEAHKIIDLNIIFVHPEHRRQGVASLMMDWGKKKADEMGVEMWLDATVHGVPLYKAHGFVVVNENDIRPTSEDPGQEWQEIEKRLVPMVMWQMCRPAGRDYKAGETAFPWEKSEA